MRIAHVATVDLSLRYLLLGQLRSLQEAGYEVVGISSAGTEVPRIEGAGIRHIAVRMTRSPLTPFQDLKALWYLLRVFRRERFTIVHTHNPKPGFLAQLAAKLAGVPIIINTVHGFYFHDRMHPGLRKGWIVLESIAARCSDVILSQSREDIATAIREGVCGAEKIKYLGNGIDLARFDRSRIPAEGLAEKRAQLGIRNGALVVGFVGRLVREKGLLELFGAARILRERGVGVKFLVVGPADSEKPHAVTPRVAQEYGVAEAFYFLGLRQDMPELYALMDVLVLPSHREGFPRAPMEASAMGVPCVVTDIRGCRESVQHGCNGLVVPVGDTQGLANALLDLLTNHKKARRMGEEGRRMALERFDERLVFKRVKAEYTRLLVEKGFSIPTVSLV